MNNNGLSEEEVKKYRNLYGTNEIVKTKSNSFLKLLLMSLGDPMIKILLIVLALKFVFLFAENDWFETLGILIAIFLASFISSISEYGSNKAFEELIDKNNKKEVKVKRSGSYKLVDVKDIVVNDIVYVGNGDIIPADGYLISGKVMVDESCINGESKESEKIASTISVSDKNMLYKGTVVTEFEGVMKVNAVGEKTLYGMIAKELFEESGESPLKSRLRHLAKIISRIGYVGAFLVFFSYLFSIVFIKNGFNMTLVRETITNYPLMIDSFIVALTLAVTIIIVSVPEGLPMMVALVLSTNMKKMIKQNVLVRKMVGIETAGNLDFLLSDKTGTITNGKMSVMGVVSYYGKMYANEVELLKKQFYYNLVGNLLILNNNVIKTENGMVTGNSTDKALYNFMNYESTAKILDKELFDSDKKYSSVKTSDKTYYKGAAEVIVPWCDYYVNEEGKKEKLLNKDLIWSNISHYMKKGFRILALAYKENDSFVYAGFVILKDAIRKEAKEGVDLIRRAGIKMIIVTGDALDTTLYVASELDLINKDSICLTSKELELMSDEEIASVIDKIKVVARAKPNDKSRLVKIISQMNYVVGMTGDGINDAPALKKASVGFAMGSGTEVAKEAADIIILDDNIKSISLAVLYGRTIFKNIRKFIIFQLTMNIGAMSLSIIGPFIGIDTPVTSMQMLWINMIMDTLAGLAFAYEEPSYKYMDERPKGKNEPIINKYMYNEICFTGFYSSILCLLFLKIPFFKDLIRFDVDNRYLMTAFFALFVFIGIFNAFNARTDKYNLFDRITHNKMFIVIFLMVLVMQIIFIYYGGVLFRTYGLTIMELVKVLLISFSVIPVDLFRKYIFKHYRTGNCL